MENREWHRVVQKLGGTDMDAPVICSTCGAQLRNYADKCKVSYRETCPGWQAVDKARRAA